MKSNPKETIFLRVSPDEKESYLIAAVKDNRSLNQWIKVTLNKVLNNGGQAK